MTEEATPTFRIHKIFTKDSSFESPRAPDIFLQEQAWQPKISLQLNSESRQFNGGMFECCLTLTVTVNVPVEGKEDPETAYLAEVKQAGLFEIAGIPEQQLPHMLGAYCPNVIFPFARQQVCDLAVAGGFPQLLLEPINFDALFAQQQQQAAPAAEGEESVDLNLGDDKPETLQ